MSFTIESEKQNRISFLDVKIIREDKAFTTSAYHNTTFSGGYTHFENIFIVYLWIWYCLHTRL